MWPVYRTMLDSFNGIHRYVASLLLFISLKLFHSVPLPHHRAIKSKYEHKDSEVNGKRREVDVRFGLDLQKRGIDENALTKEGQFEYVSQLLKHERSQMDDKSPYYAHLRSYILDQLDATVKQEFKLRPFDAPMGIKTTNFIPVPDKTYYFPVLHSPSADYNANSLSRSVRSMSSEINWEKLVSSDDSEVESEVSDVSEE
jgi:hypothetical protein